MDKKIEQRIDIGSIYEKSRRMSLVVNPTTTNLLLCLPFHWCDDAEEVIRNLPSTNVTTLELCVESDTCFYFGENNAESFRNLKCLEISHPEYMNFSCVIQFPNLKELSICGQMDVDGFINFKQSIVLVKRLTFGVTWYKTVTHDGRDYQEKVQNTSELNTDMLPYGLEEFTCCEIMDEPLLYRLMTLPNLQYAEFELNADIKHTEAYRKFRDYATEKNIYIKISN